MKNITKDTKKIIYTVLGVLILGGLFFGLSKVSNKNKIDTSEYTVSDIKKLDEADQKKALEEKLKQYQEQVNSLPQDANSSDKYSAYVTLSEAQIALKMYDEAFKSLMAIPDDKRNSKRVYRQFAEIYQAKDDKFKAMENANLAIALDENDPASWLIYLDSASSLSNEELNGKYRTAIVATKSNLEIMISYARFATRTGDKANAIAAWETARNMNPAQTAEYDAEIAKLR